MAVDAVEDPKEVLRFDDHVNVCFVCRLAELGHLAQPRNRTADACGHVVRGRGIARLQVLMHRREL